MNLLIRKFLLSYSNSTLLIIQVLSPTLAKLIIFSFASMLFASWSVLLLMLLCLFLPAGHMPSVRKALYICTSPLLMLTCPWTPTQAKIDSDADFAVPSLYEQRNRQLQWQAVENPTNHKPPHHLVLRSLCFTSAHKHWWRAHRLERSPQFPPVYSLKERLIWGKDLRFVRGFWLPLPLVYCVRREGQDC